MSVTNRRGCGFDILKSTYKKRTANPLELLEVQFRNISFLLCNPFMAMSFTKENC